MSVRWDNQLYEWANDKVALSNEHFSKQQYEEAVKKNLSARFFFLCDMITNCVLLPLAIIGVCFGTLHLALMWNRTVFTRTKNFIFEKTNHLIISCIGLTLSPTLAHKIKDSQVPAYLVLALRISVIAGGAYWAFFN